jgi:2'-5' RNA ligase
MTTPLSRRLSSNTPAKMPSYTTYTQTLPNTSTRKQKRTIPLITTTYLPVPYVKPLPSPSHKKLKPYPPPILPSRPQPARWHYRNELQRRVSPTASTFTLNPTSPTFPSETKVASFPMTATSLSPSNANEFSTRASRRPSTEVVEENVYVLTLKTSKEMSEQMQRLRRKWFPEGRNKVPAHITLFHALPGSRIIQVSKYLETLSRQTSCFVINSGDVLKRRNGVAIGLGQGEEEIKKVFGEVRDQFLECLSMQDRSLKAHWTVMNKEEDGKRVDEAYQDVESAGVVKGIASGLILWRYEKNGTWSFEREFEFLTGEDQRGKDDVLDVEVDRFL